MPEYSTVLATTDMLVVIGWVSIGAPYFQCASGYSKCAPNCGTVGRTRSNIPLDTERLPAMLAFAFNVTVFEVPATVKLLKLVTNVPDGLRCSAVKSYCSCSSGKSNCRYIVCPVTGNGNIKLFGRA